MWVSRPYQQNFSACSVLSTKVLLKFFCSCAKRLSNKFFILVLVTKYLSYSLNSHCKHQFSILTILKSYWFGGLATNVIDKYDRKKLLISVETSALMLVHRPGNILSLEVFDYSRTYYSLSKITRNFCRKQSTFKAVWHIEPSKDTKKNQKYYKSFVLKGFSIFKVVEKGSQNRNENNSRYKKLSQVVYWYFENWNSDVKWQRKRL